MTQLPTLLAATALLAAATATAQNERPGKQKAPRPVQAWGQVWQPNVSDSMDLALRRDRLVAWFRVLGELQGAT